MRDEYIKGLKKQTNLSKRTKEIYETYVFKTVYLQNVYKKSLTPNGYLKKLPQKSTYQNLKLLQVKSLKIYQ